MRVDPKGRWKAMKGTHSSHRQFRPQRCVRSIQPSRALEGERTMSNGSRRAAEGRSRPVEEQLPPKRENSAPEGTRVANEPKRETPLQQAPTGKGCSMDSIRVRKKS